MLSTIASFVLLAAEEGGHGESSKSAFYIVGGLAALYGVLIAIFGLKKHDFPATKGAARGVFLLSTVVVVAAMVSSVLTS